MLKLLMTLLPPQAKAGIQLATLLTQALDTPEERQAASDRSMAAAYEEDPDRFTFGT